ncbi:tRNA 2-thiouridine(34) synthase MnmA [Candidatus Shikimatogenerans bostrichidophilus]|uniref:tRNA 2-thiouridine(34) synthase MnmA n=1 Tax=Candidatus Shikimatogenerans bostrichidophilus TaxID=2943807 RepID=UPI002965F721
MKKVVIALSGGVDSSVSAYLLKKKGYEVIGIFMYNWSNNNCMWEDIRDAMLISNKLKIPFYVLDLRKEYRKGVINYMYEGYKKGITPNPDIICNEKIKFGVFLKKALKLKVDYIATGHYVRKKEINKEKKYCILSGKDEIKDQSYFLCRLNQYQLSKSLFPLGNMTKKEVRELAIKLKFYNAYKKDSQGLCFVGKIKLIKFLQKKIKQKIGDIYYIYSKKKKNIKNIKNENEYENIYNYKIIGKHYGNYYFTIGQRKHLNIKGYKYPLFLFYKNKNRNILYVCKKNHKELYKKFIFIKKNTIHWIRKKYILNLIKKKKGKIKVMCKIRYNQKMEKASLLFNNLGVLVKFDKNQFAVTPGQFIVWYINKELIGSGII